MTAYYNEIDPYAAQWLRNLIAAGHIAAGDVDERSIEDVRPDDLRGYTQCHFFAGIGVWSYALRQSGWSDDRPVWTGSCPCQPFSAAGKGAAFADERHLWPAFHHIIKECRPAIVFGEQVASKAVDDWIDLVHADLEAVGYSFGSVPFPSAGVGAPHIRDRNYWVAHADDAGLEGHRGLGKVTGTQRREDARRHAGAASMASGVGDSIRIGLDSGRDADGEHDGNLAGTADQQRSGMADTHDDGCDPRSLAGLHTEKRHPQPCGYLLGLADAPSDRRGRPWACASAEEGRDAGSERGWIVSVGSEGCSISDGKQATRVGSPIIHSGLPTNGFWRAADWLGCRDGKWRPVEPGTFPLAHGATSRVGRLRAYGNAINAEAAKAFIRSVMEAA